MYSETPIASGKIAEAIWAKGVGLIGPGPFSKKSAAGCGKIEWVMESRRDPKVRGPLTI